MATTNGSNDYEREVIDPGDRASEFAKKICFQSHKNCPAVRIIPHQPGNFRGPVSFTWAPHILQEMTDTTLNSETWEVAQAIENDGAGGKPQFHTLVGVPESFSLLGWEIIAMCADDLARTGRLPAIMVNQIDAQGVTGGNWSLVEATLDGYGQALADANLVNITGEFAIMKHQITAFCSRFWGSQLILSWSGACLGLTRRKFLIDGSAIRPAMPIVGIHSPGYRCNGGTFFTKVIQRHFKEWSRDGGEPPEELIAFAKKLTVPSQSYAKTLCELIGWNPDGSAGTPVAQIAGIAHITGGGVWKKLGELLPNGVGAMLYNMPAPAPVLLEAQEMSQGTDFELSDWQCYGTLHGGCGMLIVAKSLYDTDVIIQAFARHGFTASLVGETIKSEENEIQIISRFYQKDAILSSLNKF